MSRASRLLIAILLAAPLIDACAKECASPRECGVGQRCVVSRDRNGTCESCDSTEIAYDGEDNDCNPDTLDLDLDGDRDNWINSPILPGTDCDDHDPKVTPLMPEVCGDGNDNNCDGRTDERECADRHPPSVTISSPLPGELITDRLRIAASASDDLEVARVDFYAGDALVGTAVAPPYDLEVRPSAVADGRTLLRAVAVDLAGRTGSDQVEVLLDVASPPVIVPTAPLEGRGYEGGLTVEFTALDEGAGVDTVSAALDGAELAIPRAPPFRTSIDTDLLPEGPHVLVIAAADRAGHAAETSIRFFVDRTPPIVSFVEPATGVTISGPTRVIVRADDPHGIASITVGRSMSSSSPFETTIDPSMLPLGYSMLTAVANDGTIIDGVPRGHGASASIRVLSDNGALMPCTGAIPFPYPLGASGSTAGQINRSEGVCGTAGVGDVLYEWVAPTGFDGVTAIVDADFRVALHAHRDFCGAAFDIGCDQSTSGTGVSRGARVSIGRVERGEHIYFGVESEVPGQGGDFTIRLAGSIAPGQPCDPNNGNPDIRCEALSSCESRGAAGFFCTGLDCVDGIDADHDGTIDEDAAACTDPPVLACADQTEAADDFSLVEGNNPLQYKRLEILSAPLGANAYAYQAFAVRVEPEGPLPCGTYRLRRIGADPDSGMQMTACDFDYRVHAGAGLRVEAVWNVGVPNPLAEGTDVNVHLMHPDGQRWMTGAVPAGSLDASAQNPQPDWGVGGDENNVFIAWNAYHGRGVDALILPTPEQNRPYRVGVHFNADPRNFGVAEIYVNIHWNEELKASFGPVALALDEIWRIADVTFSGSECTIVPLGTGPSVISSVRDMDGTRR